MQSWANSQNDPQNCPILFFLDIIFSYSLLHLAAESHDLSQAEKIITVTQSWANSQNDTQNCPGWTKLSFWVIIVCSALHNSYSLFSLR
jgi:hypothetical protein